MALAFGRILTQATSRNLVGRVCRFTSTATPEELRRVFVEVPSPSDGNRWNLGPKAHRPPAAPSSTSADAQTAGVARSEFEQQAAELLAAAEDADAAVLEEKEMTAADLPPLDSRTNFHIVFVMFVFMLLFVF